NRQIAVLDREARPRRLHQCILCDRCSRAINEGAQQRHRTLAQGDRFSGPKQGLALRIKAKWAECITRGDCSTLLFGSFRNSSQHLHDLPVTGGQSAPSPGGWVQGNQRMESLSELSGYVASTLVLLTFVAKDMRVLRTVAIFSNLAFIAYGTIEWLPPVLFLHMALLPLNIVRLAEILRTTRTADDLTQAVART